MLRDWDHTAALTHKIESILNPRPRPFEFHNPIRSSELLEEGDSGLTIGDLRRALNEENSNDI